MKNKIRVFNTNVKAVLLYGAETRRTTVITTKRMNRPLSTAAYNESLASDGMKSLLINGCGLVATHMSDAGGTGDPTEKLEMDWSYSPHTSRQHYTTNLNLESRGEKEKRTT